MIKTLYIILICSSVVFYAQTTTTVQGFVKDKDFPSYNIDSAFVKGVDLNTLESRFEEFTDMNGFYSAIVTTSAVDDKTKVLTSFDLSQNYPNPFNPSTKFEVSVSKPGNYKVEFFDVTAAELFKQEFDLYSGNYTFSVSGLGSAGVKFYRISGEGFSETKKMVQLDGSVFNPVVSVSSGGFSRLGKVNNLEMRVSAEKQGYFKDSVDVSFVEGGTYTQDFSLTQIPKLDTIWFYTSQNLVPTNTPANNASVVGSANGSTIFSGVTNSAGEFETFFIANYVTNPNDSTERIYTPSMILVNVSRSNAVNKTEHFIVDGSDITWYNNLQQTLINKNGSASGNIQNEIGQPVINANVKLYNNDNNNLFGQSNTNVNGNYLINFSYWGFENDPGDVHTPINDLRLEASANNHNPETIVKPFANPVVTDFVLNRVAYEFNATIKLYNTKGDVITDLDSLKLTWPDGTNQGFANNNGVVQINKLLYSLNSDTTAIITHNQPGLYLKWMMGTTNNPEKVELIYQNPGPGPNTVAKIPLNQINNKTTELYLIPKQAKYGPNNDLLIDMDGPIVTEFLSRPTFGIVSGFRSTAQYDTTDIAQPLFNQTNNEPIPQNHIDRANNEIQKFLTAIQWSHKKLLNYRFTQIESSTDPFYLYLLNPNGRNLDNVNISTFYQGGPINIVNIATDGTKRIKYSTSKYNINTGNAQIQEEIFDSMLNTNIDDQPQYISTNNMTYTDLAQNLIGISLIMKPGTYYNE